MSKRVLMLVGEFSEEYEIFVFQQALEAVGHKVDIVCPDTAKGYRLKTSVHDFGRGLSLAKYRAAPPVPVSAQEGPVFSMG